MNSRWFKEERALPNSERAERTKEVKEVLGHSTLMAEKLQRIIDEEIESTYLNEEDTSGINYAYRVAASAGARKVLRELRNLLDMKGA